MYFVVAPQANQLFHFLSYALSFLVSSVLACKMVVAATILLGPVVASRHFARLGLSRLPALLVLPLVCGFLFRGGLVANLLGFVLFLASLPLLERLAKRPSIRLALGSVGASALIFFAHESAALIFAMVAGYFMLVRARGAKAFALQSVPLVTILMLALVQLQVGARLAGANMREIGNDYGLDALERLTALPGAVFGGYDRVRLAVLASVWLASLVAFGVAKGRPFGKELALRVLLWRYRYPLLSVALFVMFFTFPMSLGGTTLLSHRFLPAACSLLVMSCAPQARAACGSRGATVSRALLAAAVPFVMLGVELKSFVDADHRFRDLDAVLRHVPNNVAVAQLDLTPMPPGAIGPIPGAASRVLAVHGGRMLFALADMPPNPIYTRREWQWNEPIVRLSHSPYGWMPAHDARRFSYLLARGVKPRARAFVAEALKPEQELVASQGEWDLYRSTVPVVPLASPDESLPEPRPETLADRVNALLLRGGRPR
jgi:hypothetical protein